MINNEIVGDFKLQLENSKNPESQKQDYINRKYDTLYIGDCDSCVQQLCKQLKWTSDLEKLIHKK